MKEVTTPFNEEEEEVGAIKSDSQDSLVSLIAH